MHAVLRVALPAIVAALCAAPGLAQARVTSLAELERELAAGDFVTVTSSSGQPVQGWVKRLTADSLELRGVKTSTGQGNTSKDLTLALSSIRTLERPRDPVLNGTLVGAAVGAGAGGGMFLTALVIDRNEIDEWLPFYLGATAVCAGVGASIGWAVDAARSRPHFIFETPAGRRTTSMQRRHARGVVIGVAVSF